MSSRSARRSPQRLLIESLEDRRVLDSTVVFNELMYHPTANEETLEWVELYNQQAVDMDLSGWQIRGGVDFTFPQGTILGGGDYLVLAASPGGLQAASGFAGALGPFIGRLSNSGESLRLVSIGERTVDQLAYADDGDWPVAADGSGLTLAKRDPDAATSEGANWADSRQIGGTPGARNFPSLVPQIVETTVVPIDAVWRYNQAGDQGTAWRETLFDDAAWPSGPALFHLPNTQTYPAAKNTPLTAGQMTYYFRTAFDVSGDVAGAGLKIHPIVDDGAVYYLNGHEIYRQNMPLAPAVISFTTAAASGVGVASYAGPFSVPAEFLVAGNNVLAVEVHQSSAGSIDLAFGTEVLLARTIIDPVVNPPALAINEVAGALDGVFSVELYNRDTTPIDLAGMVLSRAADTTVDFTVAAGTLAPGAFVVYTAAQLGFMPADGEKIFLYMPSKAAVLDAIVVKPTARGRSPDGAGPWRYVEQVTPLGANDVVLHDEIVINEIMYDHRPIQNQPARFSETPIFPIDATWKYDDSGVDRGVFWKNSNYDDSVWPSGAGLFYVETAILPAAKNTPLAAARNTYYFRKTFNFAGDLAGATLSLSPVVDDGAVFYLNGVEVYRLNMPAGDIDYTTSAMAVIDNAAYGSPIIVPAPTLINGVNVLAVEVHQANSPTGGGPTIAAEPGYQIAWDGSNGDFNSPNNPALVPDNVALATHGVTAYGSSEYGAGIHLIGNINDGRYGNSNSWLANFPAGDANPYIGVRFNQTLNLSSIAWGRDNGNTVADACGGTCTDRSVGVYTVQITNVPAPGMGTTETGNAATGWKTIGTFTYGAGGGGFTPHLRHRYTLSENGSPIPATGLRLKVSDDDIAIDELELNAAADSGNSDVVYGTSLASVVELSPATSYQEFAEEWIELYNRGVTTVDLTGWRIDEGIDFNFPAGTTIAPGSYLVVANDKVALQAVYPAINIAGDFSGRLANGGDRIVLKDPRNNVADDVRYYDGGAWSTYAGGLGSSLELVDPDADNAKGESWRASDESGKSAWQTYTYRGVAVTEFPPARWNEFVLGMFGDAEVLIDDVSVIESPGGTATQKLVNGSFQSDTVGQLPAGWRFVGNERTSRVEVDPTNAANKVLRLISTGQTSDRSDHAETTFVGNVPATNGLEYEITFRAKWLAGTDQINTRLYFNRLARRATLDAPQFNGTPGLPNSHLVANSGPTYSALAQTPVVPNINEQVTVSVVATDPDGVAGMTLRYAVGSGAFSSAAMTHQGGGRYTGVIPGQAAAAIVRFYVEGTDSLGAISTYPAGGVDSRALYKVQDGQAQPAGKHSIRIIMTAADTAFLHDPANVMSSEEMRATVVYDEREVYYNVGVSLKGSMAARPSTTFLGFRVQFNPEQKFRGVQEEIALDRSGRGSLVSNGQDEIFVKHMMAAAGGLPVQHDDLVYVVSPRGTENGPALLMLGEYSEVFLDDQFQNGGDGEQFNYDLIYYQNATTNGLPDGPKTPVGYGHPSYNVDLENLGEDKERYRWHFRSENNGQEDDYSQLIDFLQAMSLTGSTTGGALDVATQQLMDVDEWMRLFAAQSLAGSGPDLYGRGLPHNLRLYFRPDDNRALAFQWDWDLSSFGLATTADIFPGGAIRKVIDITANKRLFYGHLHDLMNTTFNRNYLTYWTTHYASLLPGQHFSGALTYLDSRNAFVANQLPAAVPFSASTGDVTTTVTLVDEPTAAVALVPSVANGGDLLGTSWTQIAFDDGAWTAGNTAVGYERQTGYEHLLGLDILSAIDTNNDGTNENNSVFVRVPFNVDDPAAFDTLKLRMKYDDGFVAYLNGVKVAEMNAPTELAWNSEATVAHDDAAAVAFEEFNISAFRNALVAGENVLAIQGLNRLSTSSDMLFSPQLVAEQIQLGSDNVTIDGPVVTLGGSAWVNVREIRLQGQPNPLAVVFPSISTWQATIPVAFGTHPLVFEAYDFHGNLIATDTITVTTSFVTPTQDNLRVTEIQYHPADPTAAELAIDPTFQDDDFEYLEIQNVGATPIDLTGVQIANDVTFNFTGGGVATLDPGEYLVVVESLAGFAARYNTAGLHIAGEYSGNLGNAGGTLELIDSVGNIIQGFTYDDNGVGWHPSTDGLGPSLVIVDPLGSVASWNDGGSWRPSFLPLGSPGAAENSLIVINTNDSGPGSLRQAVLAANAAVATPTIEFDIPGAGTHVIQLASNLPNLTQPVRLNLDAGETVEIGTFNAFTFGQFSSLAKLGAGMLTIGGAQGHSSAAQLVVSAGVLVMVSDGGTNLTILDNATVTLSATQHLADLQVGAGAVANLAAGGGRVLVLGSLSIHATGKLNLADNDLIVQATPATRNAVLATITTYLTTGSNALSWNGPGIASSSAANDLTFLTALGLMLNDNGLGGAFYPSFSGQPVDANSVLVKYTYYGDADLSGLVDGTDYALIDNGFNASLNGWFNGDFDFTAVVDGTDYALIDNAFNSQGGPLSDNEPAGLGPIPRAAGSPPVAGRDESSWLALPLTVGAVNADLFDSISLDDELLEALTVPSRRGRRQ